MLELLVLGSLLVLSLGAGLQGLTIEAVEVCDAEDVCCATLGVTVCAAADEGLALVEGWHCGGHGGSQD